MDSFRIETKTQLALKMKYVDMVRIFEGRGTTVYGARVQTPGGRRVVLKMIDVALRSEFLKTQEAFREFEPGVLAELVRMHAREEIIALDRLGMNRHPNVISMYSYFCDDRDRYFIEINSCAGTLEMRLHEHAGVLPLPLVERYFFHILRGLAYIHARGLCHKDLQPANIFIDSENVAKISDFGVAALIPPDGIFPPSPEVNPTLFRPVEILLERPYTKAVDVWSVGCMLSWCLRTPPVFIGQTRQAQLDIIASFAEIPPALLPTDDDHGLHPPNVQFVGFDITFSFVPDRMRILLRRLLAVDPRRRISAAVACEQPVFVDVVRKE